MGLLSQALKAGNLVIEEDPSISKAQETTSIPNKEETTIEVAFPTEYWVHCDDGIKKFVIYDEKYCIYHTTTEQEITIKGCGTAIHEITLEFMRHWSSWLGDITMSYINSNIDEATLWEAQELFLKRLLELMIEYSPLRRGINGKVVIDERVIRTFKVLPPPLKDWIPIPDPTTTNPLEKLIQAQLNSNTIQSLTF